ncbi:MULTISPECIES: hypothetical protein [Paraburkholderia]|uniref:hypothetical protein n=1 Tax=Paraburkholderia TaxID=1822464 RepID=UPI0003633C61|nr:MULTISPECIES: hypothetical protein [Paraburkholderia]MDH6149554.1 hypothetical protein [Paraburkholderia sp. WSM4179]
MEPTHLTHIPASTRATLSHLGIPVTAFIDGRAISVPPHELPGEVEWRVDLLRWLVRKVFFHLASLRRDERVPALLAIEKRLVAKSGLHVVEAEAVAESALLSIKDASDEDASAIMNAIKLHEAHLESEWTMLEQRYNKIILGDNAPRGDAEAGGHHDGIDDTTRAL